MWDRKRQTIWLSTAIVLVTFVVHREAYDEDGHFDAGYFLLLEIVFLAIICLMFYIYSRQKS